MTTGYAAHAWSATSLTLNAEHSYSSSEGAVTTGFVPVSDDNNLWKISAEGRGFNIVKDRIRFTLRTPREWSNATHFRGVQMHRIMIVWFDRQLTSFPGYAELMANTRNMTTGAIDTVTGSVNGFRRGAGELRQYLMDNATPEYKYRIIYDARFKSPSPSSDWECGLDNYQSCQALRTFEVDLPPRTFMYDGTAAKTSTSPPRNYSILLYFCHEGTNYLESDAHSIQLSYTRKVSFVDI